MTVIDEIELHLHARLQREILPKLLKLFPKVQFIITSHSPLFILGMREEFNDDGFDIYQMPSAIKITAEQFSEFQETYSCFANTEAHLQQISDAIKSVNSHEALIITEGATDWKHMEAEYNALKILPTQAELFNGLDIEFLKYHPRNCDIEAKYKLDMGDSELCSMCKHFAKIGIGKTAIFIADNDVLKTTKELGADNDDLSYKNWGNNIFSFILPVPVHRESTSEICIEHYYTDEEIKTEIEIGGIQLRIYLGNEFNEDGHTPIDIGKFCTLPKLCGKESIKIIDGSQGAKVKMMHGDGRNYALSKMNFANYILEKEPSFDKFDFSSFIELFKTIKEIISIKK